MQTKKVNKKGAIELSMTTIIVIIIGITLLSLGLFWVRGTFRNIVGLSEEAFSQAEGAISDIFEEVDSPVFISPPSIEIEQGSSRTVSLKITNFEDKELNTKAKVESSDKLVECSFADTLKAESKPYILKSGQQVEIKLLVRERNGALGTKVCNVEVSSINGDNTESLIIEVVTKKGLFG
ncbi:hypothetical protein HYX16_03445 [Candidatus Woesearchaeota archaeon]|nr:hypothetical protein [Candidatus Woesearchaeota archaeon]